MQEAMNRNEEAKIDQETQNVFEELRQNGPLPRTDEKVSLDENVVGVSEGETHAFDAQMDSLLSILINSVYSSKDYFLRELISNASDANDKRKKLSYTTHQIIEEEQCIKIIPNKENRTITICDTGIGMSKADMINYLGSIASSGTKEFKKMLQSTSSEGQSIDNLIGQFGLGFYAAFLVADQVDVISRKGDESPCIWSSRGPGGYVVAPYTGEHAQGTSVVLHISEQCKSYLEEKTLEDIIKAHSSFIGYPIYLFVIAEKTRKVSKAVEEKKEENSEKADEDVVEDAAEEKEDEETYFEEEFKKLNTQMPLWARDPKEETITEKEYEDFYKSISNDWEKHCAVSHSTIEGDFKLQVLLFAQNRPPFRMFEGSKKSACNIKLYVQNVLISSDLSEAVPEWMSFIHGVISSKDIPINLSREIVQGKSVMKLIKRVISKKVIDMLNDMAFDKENYLKSYSNFSTCLKTGIYMDNSDVGAKLLKLLRFKTTKSEEPISFEEYVSRMAEGQKKIYVITGMNEKEVMSHPALDRMTKYEVIYMPDPMDEFVIQVNSQFNEFPFQRITSEGIDLPEEKEDTKEKEEEFKGVIEGMKAVLGDKVEKIVISTALEKLPCFVSSAGHSYSPAMEQILKAQPGGSSANPVFASGYLTKKMLEINPNHATIVGLKTLLEKGDKEKFNTTVGLLFDSCLLGNGFPISNMAEFSKRIFEFVNMGMESMTIQ
ncbi:uncharacterized protein NESG_00708 [Nematocida ausubeli]|uniref:Heat shock protein 90 n=1 Tax=Nematocida ausubeli (strain ATCC PRA-371 / ERTm2) TaxID=1913371 RepID=A0A086J339_NEMA1|nr:uncharacterized protein NESG_00708 [Nematocida ausubeli]KFG26557.1 hypothetical protein NESG_00708 [Nematocida ausubeli]